MLEKDIEAGDVKTAVQQVVPYLEDTGNGVPNAIYIAGWYGLGSLGASAVIRAIAEHPPPSLREKFDKIIHIDCSRWKSLRALQRAIADELNFTQQLATDFDIQEEEDDFSGVDQGSRAEIASVARVINRSLVQYIRCLVVFHNGSDDMVDLTSCGIPQPEVFGTKVLWTFGGRLRICEGIHEKVPSSHIFIRGSPIVSTNVAEISLAQEARAITLHTPKLGIVSTNDAEILLAEEARAITLHTRKLGIGVTHEIATECCLYLMSLHSRGGDIDYNWSIHASNYWVCDGIVRGGQDNQSWKLARALQQQIRVEDYSPTTRGYFYYKLDISTKHWISIASSSFKEIPPGTTSLFIAPEKSTSISSLPSDRFHEADQLRVLKLCCCTFSFSSPPFHCCRNLRFLGLESCVDERQPGDADEDKQRGAPAVETFQRLWVLDVSHTDWELDFPLETEEPVVAKDLREVHINKGRIWRRNLAWKRLPNLEKLRVVEPTRSWWETGRKDEFKDMVKLELLDLSMNSTMNILPSLSGATNLKTLVLDGCVGLENIGPGGLPPSLESFCLDVGAGEDHKKSARISRICLAGCARLADFRLVGSLPNLEELDLSHTALKMLDLTDEAAVHCLKRVLLARCEQLRSISWPQAGMQRLRLLYIDTRSGSELVGKPSSLSDSLMACHDEGEEHCHAFVATADMRFLQSLVFLWERTAKFKLNICFSSTSKDDDGIRSCYKKKMGHSYSSTRQQLASGPPLPKPLLAYNDIPTEQQINTETDGNSSVMASFFQPLDLHVEIGEGASDISSSVTTKVRDAIHSLMDRVQSLHMHDNCSITNVTPEHIFLNPANVETWKIMNELKWCHVERCPKLDTVFATNYYAWSFYELETFWAAHLRMARSIWRRAIRPKPNSWFASGCFTRLRAIYLHFCPRLVYVHALSSRDDLSCQLETLHILCCGDLRHVFPVEEEFLEKLVRPPSVRYYPETQWESRRGMLEFPKLKDLYLHGLPSLQLICEAKMYAPNLETIYLRDCRGLRRLPATAPGRRLPVAVDCEKDCWDKLEWDGMEFGHHPSLFEPRHSKYYKKRHLRGTVLR